MGNEKFNSYWKAEPPQNHDRVGIENFIRANALRDRRFPPIQLKELPSLECTVSLLPNYEPGLHYLDWETKRILSLDIGLLISGAKERGELEGRVTTLIKEIKESGKVVLFIDEVHTLIGSGTVGRGNKGSGLNIGNLLKPSLGRGEI